MDNKSLNNDFITGFQAFESQLNGKSQLPIHQIRKKAIDAFQSLGVPSPKNEEYKFTNFGKALNKEAFDFTKQTQAGHLNKEQLNAFSIDDLDAVSFVFVNGILSEELSSTEGLGSDIEIESLEEAIQNQNALLDTHFGKYVKYQEDAYAALNTAFSEHGTVIKVKANKVVDTPILLHFINDASESSTHSFPRNLIVLEKNCQASIIEKHDTIGEHSNFTDTVSEIILEENAIANHYKLQNIEGNSYHVNCTEVIQASSSVFNSVTISLRGKMVRNNLNIALNDKGCEAYMYGLYITDGSTHVDNHTVADHRKPNAYSNELYKGILDDKSKGVFNGKIFVREDAQKTNAFQSNSNILLSDTAVMNTKPQLEIWADDVKCSHGCTSGQLDQDAMFYLRARGISEESARAMLLYAFAMDVLEHIKIPALKDYLDKIIATRLNKNF